MTDRDAIAAHIACVCEALTGEGPRPLGGGRVYHFQGCCADSDLAALAQPAEPGLTDAWARAEAALPEDHVLAEVRLDDDRSGWSASTDTAALNALAEKLEANDD